MGATLTSTTTEGQGESGSDDYEEVIYSTENSRNGASPPDSVWFGWVLWYINHCWLLKQFNLASTHLFCLHTGKYKNSSFQTLRLSVIIQFSSIWPIYRILSGATPLGHNGPRNDGNEGILHIPQNSSSTEALPSNCLVWYPGYTLGWLLILCKDAVVLFYRPSRSGHSPPYLVSYSEHHFLIFSYPSSGNTLSVF